MLAGPDSPTRLPYKDDGLGFSAECLIRLCDMPSNSGIGRGLIRLLCTETVKVAANVSNPG
jgi:hypothetical protein